MAGWTGLPGFRHGRRGVLVGRVGLGGCDNTEAEGGREDQKAGPGTPSPGPPRPKAMAGQVGRGESPVFQEAEIGKAES